MDEKIPVHASIHGLSIGSLFFAAVEIDTSFRWLCASCAALLFIGGARHIYRELKNALNSERRQHAD